MQLKTLIAAAPLLAVSGLLAVAQTTQAPPSSPTPPASPQRTAPSPATPPVVEAKPVKGQVVQQPEGTMLSTDLVGANVRVGDQEKAGSVSDLVVSKDGKVEAVVLSVGGFLGLGSREIAIKLEDVQIATDGKKPVVQLEARKIDLERAPPFKSLASIKAEQDAAKARQERPVPPSATNPPRPAN